MQINIAQESHIIGMIYDAAMDTKLWPNVLEAIVEYSESNSAIFTVLDQLNPDYNFMYAHNIYQEGLERYKTEHIDVIDMRLHGTQMRQLGVGKCLLVNAMNYSEVEGSDEYILYEKCLKPSNIEYLNGVLLEEGIYRWSMLAVHRPKCAAPYSQIEEHVLERLGTHLRRALQIYRQLVEVKNENLHLYKLLEQIKVGIILLDHEKKVCFSNNLATKILNQSTLIRIDITGRLKTSMVFQSKLDQLISSAMFQDEIVLNEEVDAGGVIGIYHPDEKNRPMTLTITPMSMDHNKKYNQHKHMVAIYITEMNLKHKLSYRLMKAIYQLSNREIEICELFVNGLNLEEISKQCNITLSSVRTYFKTIYSKTNCTSQVQLMQLLLGLTVDFEHIQ